MTEEGNTRARRSYGSGSIQAKGPGEWLVQLNVGVDPITGKRRRPGVRVKGTRRDAERALKQLRDNIDDRRVDRSNITLRQLLDKYLEARPKMSPNTAAENQRAVDRYLPAQLAKQPLRKIGVYELDELYRHLEAAGGVCRKKTKCAAVPCPHGAGEPLAESTVIRFHHIVHAAFEQAVKWQWITSNPADLVQLGDVDEAIVDVDPDEAVILLAHLATLTPDGADRAMVRQRGGDGRLLPRQASDPTPLPAFVDVLLATGARVGEVCALTYGQLALDRTVDGEARPQVKIDASIARGKGGATRKKTKTKKERRPVLDAYTADVLRRRRADWLPAALAAGTPIADLHVFPSSTDVRQPIRPDAIARLFAAARGAAGVSDQVTLRNLRHLVASVLAEATVSPTTIAGRLGNSAAIVQARYAHILDSGNAAAADIVNKRLGRSG